MVDGKITEAPQVLRWSRDNYSGGGDGTILHT